MGIPAETKERIAMLLVNKVQHGIIAGACGISQGYLTQLIASDEELQRLLATEQAKELGHTFKRDTQVTGIEERLLAQLPTLVEGCTSLGEAVTALQKLQDIKKRQKEEVVEQQPGGDASLGLKLDISVVARERLRVVMNDRGAIIQVGEQTVEPMLRDDVELFLTNVGKKVAEEMRDATAPEDLDW